MWSAVAFEALADRLDHVAENLAEKRDAHAALNIVRFAPLELGTLLGRLDPFFRTTPTAATFQ
ncbi:hypothetical protein [Methylobacterium oxalidis]|uniref:hypothetical protein n=1 Tax=Methylobacterium oxalidis TaxID=944322 RepID=UPI0033155B7C